MSRESRQRRRDEAAALARQSQRWKWLRWVIMAGCVLVVSGALWAWLGHRDRANYGGFAAKQAEGFKLPQSFFEVCMLPTNDLAKCDIALVNLLCAEGLRGSEQLKVAECLEILDGMASQIKFETDRHLYRFKDNPTEFNHSEGYFRMMMMVTVLQQDLKVHYNPERVQLPGRPIEPNEQFFANSQDVFIHGLIREGGMGTCSSMPVFLVAVGRRLGYPLKLVKAKGHLFVRWDEGERSFNIEATSIGFGSHPDTFYLTWPAPFTSEEAQAEGYLKNLTPAQELSVFLSTRGMCLQAVGNHKWALGAFQYACKKDPQSVGNQLLLANAERVALKAGALTGKHAVYLESKHLEIPEGEWKQYLMMHKQMLQSAVLLGEETDAEIEADMAMLKAAIERIKAGQPPGPASRKKVLITPGGNGVDASGEMK